MSRNQLLPISFGLCAGLLVACAVAPAPQTAQPPEATGPAQVVLPTRSAIPEATPTPEKPFTSTPWAPVRTPFMEHERVLHMESDQVRIGIDLNWGGAIREIWWNGQNLVNSQWAPHHRGHRI